MHIISKDCRGKLDSKTRKCILVGYGSVQKGYRLYEKESQKILYSRNVKFDEGEAVEQSVPENIEVPAQREVEFDILDESEPEMEQTNSGEDAAAEPRRSTRERRQYYDFERVNLLMHFEPSTLEEARFSRIGKMESSYGERDEISEGK